jgi:TM2 domain-containing membrane protein YozV
MKDKTTAGLIALLLGGLGGHKFYLEDTGTGFMYLLFSWTMIPGIVAFFEAIGFFMMDKQTFNQRYNQGALSGPDARGQLPEPNRGRDGSLNESPQQMGQNVTVNLEGNQGSGAGVADQLEKLHNLKEAGALSEEEFEEQKRKLLAD